VSELRIAPAARADLRDIRNFSKERFGARLARDYLDGLLQTFDLLAAHPRIGVARDSIVIGLRQFPYRSHRIFYREGEDGLLISRILHHARDVTGAFSNEP
jgi:toxin ParE1/3/4